MAGAMKHGEGEGCLTTQMPAGGSSRSVVEERAAVGLVSGVDRVQQAAGAITCKTVEQVASCQRQGHHDHMHQG